MAVEAGNPVAEALTAREEAIRALLEVILAERKLGLDEAAAMVLTDAEGRFALACRRYVAAVGRLPAWRQPAGWPS